MRRFLVLLIAVAALAGCRSPLTPGLSLKEANMAEGPVLIQRGDNFYLRYRRNIDPQGQNLLSVLGSKKKGDEIFFFLTRPVSANEWGNLVERPLAYDGYEEFARQGKVYWVDPDGTTHAIPIRKE